MNECLTEEYSEIMLPKNTLTDNFCAFSESKKLKIIEFGIAMLKTGEDKLCAFNNRDWADKITKIRNETDTIISDLQNENDTLKQKVNEKDINHKKDIKYLREKIRDETAAVFNTEIERLREQREELTTKISCYNEKLVKQQQDSFEMFNIKTEEMRSQWEKKELQLREDFKNALEKQAELVSSIQDTNQKKQENSTIKGQSGEEWVRNQLLSQCPTMEVIDTHQEKEKGDFILREPNIEGMIEAKNYNKNVPKKEIEKFYRDMDKNEYNYGVLASLDHGVVRRPDFHLEFRHGCPIIFLHRVRESPTKLSLAINFCKLVEKNKSCIDITNEEIVTKITNLIKPIRSEYKQMHQLLSKFKDNMEKSVNNQFKHISDIIDLLNIE